MTCTKDHHGGVCTCPPDRGREDKKDNWPAPVPPDDDYVPKER